MNQQFDLCDAAEQIEEPEIAMRKIAIEIIVGEYEHSEYLYFLGTAEDAERYGENYLSTIWGDKPGDTIVDQDGIYFSKNGEQAALLSSVEKYEAITAVTDKGDRIYGLTFELMR